MGAVFALFAAWYLWAPKIIGKPYNELLAQIHFWVFFIGVIASIYITYKSTAFGTRAGRLPGGPWRGTGKLLNIRHRGNLSNHKDNLSNRVPFMYYNFLARMIYIKTLKIYPYAGVYLLRKNLTGAMYIGSSVNLRNRMARYFYEARSNKPTNLIIVRALIQS
jgi:hypothetical protein